MLLPPTHHNLKRAMNPGPLFCTFMHVHQDTMHHQIKALNPDANPTLQKAQERLRAPDTQLVSTPLQANMGVTSLGPCFMDPKKKLVEQAYSFDLKPLLI